MEENLQSTTVMIRSKLYRQLDDCGNVYLDTKDHVGTALTFADKYLKSLNIVPGFGDLIVFTSKKGKEKFKNSLKIVDDYNFDLYLHTPADKIKSGRLDHANLIMVDDYSLPFRDVENILDRFSHMPVILCGKEKKGMQVIIDTREQKPLWDNCKKLKLEVGDYTTEKLLDKFHVERKSPQDLYGSIIQGHIRFRKEMIYATIRQTKLVVYVESTRKNFVEKRFPGGSARNCTEDKLRKMISTIEFRYKLEIVWCGTRDKMKKMLLKRLADEERKLK